MRSKAADEPVIPVNTRLLVTANRYFELDAASEIWHILRNTNIAYDAEVVFIRRGKWWLRGLIAFVFETPLLSLIDIMSRIRDYLLKKPWIMEFAQRIIPVEKVSTKFEEVKEFVWETANRRLGEEDKWAIRVSKHEANVKRRKIIEELAKGISKGKVDLENPDWIVNVEVIRNTYATAIVPTNCIIRKKEIKIQADC